MNIPELIKNTEYFFAQYGYLTVLISSFIEITPMGWVIPGGIILAIAGFFSNSQGNVNLALVIISGTLGAWLTLLGSYLLGRKSGMWLVTKLHQERNATLAKKLLQKHGGVILTTSMMANLTRFWVAYVSGVEKYHVGKFLLYSLMASLGWVSIMTLLGFFAGYERENIESIAGAVGIVGWLLLAIAGFVIYRSISHEHKHFKEDTPHDEH